MMKEQFEAENLKLTQIDSNISIAQRKIELMKRHRSRQRMIALIAMFSNFESIKSIQIDYVHRYISGLKSKDFHITYINNTRIYNNFSKLKDIANKYNFKSMMDSDEIKNMLFSQKIKSNTLEDELILFCNFFIKTSDDLDTFLCNQEINLHFLKTNLNKRQFFT